MGLIEREMQKHTPENPGRIIVKMNALVDGEIIRALYAASQKGVAIDLLIRGVCCLRPKMVGISDNIRVISIVGRFLEHSRILYFRNGGEEEVYLSSAEWMPRNLHRRVEVMFPVEGAENRARLKEILELYLKDNMKARELQPDGSYIRRRPKHGEKKMNVQEYLIAHIKQSDPIVEGAPRPKRSGVVKAKTT
jgi:polyphosphate kinase